MEPLEYLVEKFGVDLNQPSPIYINMGRRKDFPRMLHACGFKRGAEVGVYMGAYSDWLLKMIPDLEKLYLVDWWDSYPGYKDFGGHRLHEAYENVQKLCQRFPNATTLKGWSHEVAGWFADGSLDFVFIDANHDYPHCVRDIAAWEPKVRKGGIVAGHDYDDYSQTKRQWKFMQVIPAVNGWTEAYKIAPWFVTTKNKNRCWFWVK